MVLNNGKETNSNKTRRTPVKAKPDEATRYNRTELRTTLEDNDYCEEYVDNITRIILLPKQELVEELKMLDKSKCKIISTRLWELCKQTFNQFNVKKMKNRTSQDKIVEDIYYFSLMLVENKVVDDNILILITNDSDKTENCPHISDSINKIASLAVAQTGASDLEIRLNMNNDIINNSDKLIDLENDIKSISDDRVKILNKLIEFENLFKTINTSLAHCIAENISLKKYIDENIPQSVSNNNLNLQDENINLNITTKRSIETVYREAEEDYHPSDMDDFSEDETAGEKFSKKIKKTNSKCELIQKNIMNDNNVINKTISFSQVLTKTSAEIHNKDITNKNDCTIVLLDPIVNLEEENVLVSDKGITNIQCELPVKSTSSNISKENNFQNNFTSIEKNKKIKPYYYDPENFPKYNTYKNINNNHNIERASYNDYYQQNNNRQHYPQNNNNINNNRRNYSESKSINRISKDPVYYKGQTIIGKAPIAHKLTKIVGIGGTQINCKFGGIKKQKFFEVYLGRIDPQANMDDIKSHLDNINLNASDLIELKISNHKNLNQNSTKSFMFKIPYENKDKIYNSNNWPENVVVTKYKRPFQFNNQQNDILLSKNNV